MIDQMLRCVDILDRSVLFLLLDFPDLDEEGGDDGVQV